MYDTMGLLVVDADPSYPHLVGTTSTSYILAVCPTPAVRSSVEQYRLPAVILSILRIGLGMEDSADQKEQTLAVRRVWDTCQCLHMGVGPSASRAPFLPRVAATDRSREKPLWTGRWVGIY